MKAATAADVIRARRIALNTREGYISLFFRVVVLALAAYVIFTQVFLITQNKGQGMFPAIKDGDFFTNEKFLEAIKPYAKEFYDGLTNKNETFNIKYEGIKYSYEDGKELLLKDIEKELGCSLRDENGSFIPAALAREIFSDGEVLEKVEALVFPVLKEDFSRWVDEHPAAVHILESATILEKEYFRGFGDFALIMTAPFDVRLVRAMVRDSADEEQIKARIHKQIMMNNPAMFEQFCNLPFEVCENAGTTDELRSKLAEFVEKHGLTKML